MNKMRPWDAKPVTKMCRAILHKKACLVGAEKCKYSHDLKEAIATQPADIAEVEGGCPNDNLKGFCGYGVNCCIGLDHLNMAMGDSLKRDDASDSTSTRHECSVSGTSGPAVKAQISIQVQALQ